MQLNKLGAYHEVTLDIGQLVGQLLLGGIVCGTLNLVVVVVESDNVGTSELGNLASGATDTTANIENVHSLLDANLVRQVVLMASNGLVKGLAEGKAAEMEGLAPSVLVDIGGKVVVAAFGHSC